MVRHGFVAGLVAAIALAGASLAFTAASRARAQRAAAPAAAEVALPGPPPARRNGRLGWVDTGDGALRHTKVRVRLIVRLSHRRLELRIRGRLARSIPVAIGRPGSSTPTGRFSVTDEIAGGRFGPYYGCCILALSGHQPHRTPGWTGGVRLPIHGTNAPSSIGTPSSAGCLRAPDRDLHVLIRRVPLGTPVVIRP